MNDPIMTEFDQFLDVARQREKQQHLFMIFVVKEKRVEDKTQEIYNDFSLNPHMYIDKRLEEVESFSALLKESTEAGGDWDLLYVSVLEGVDLPAKQAEDRLEFMVKLIHHGENEKFLIFNKAGTVSSLDKITIQ